MNLSRSAFVVLAASAALYSGCEWTGGSDSDFNVSRTNLDASITGFYSGELDGGKAVSNPSGGQINSLLINQSGNVVEVQDSNNQTYRGSVGTPVTDGTADSGIIPAGSSLASFTVTWSGKDGTSERDVDFNGVVEFVSVTDVQGETVSRTITDATVSTTVGSDTTTEAQNNDVTSVNTSTSDSSDSLANGSTSGSNNDFTTTTATINNSGQALQQIGNNGIETSTIINNVDGTRTIGGNNTTASTANSTVNNASTGVDTSTSGTTSGSTSTTGRDTAEQTTDAGTATTTSQFALQAANSQFILRGNWVEQGGSISQVRARSAGAGTFTLVQTTALTGGDTGGGTDADGAGTVTQGGEGVGAQGGGDNL